jgi:hypothetical protein
MICRICLFLIVVILQFTAFCSEDDFVSFKGNMYLKCHGGFPAYDTAIIATVAARLGMERVERIHPDFKIGFRNTKMHLFLAYSEVALQRNRVHPKLMGFNEKCPDSDSLYISGFRVYVPDFRRVKTNLYKFIVSAYAQETGENYDMQDFIRLPEKSEERLKKLIWISPAYSMRYIHEGNPFSSLNTVLQVGYYFMDAFGLAYVIGSPIFGRDLKEKIGYSALGLAFLAEIRILVGFDLKKELKAYNLIRNSGYFVPNTVEF